MNENIRQYFDAIEVRLIESPAVASYQVIRKDIAMVDGKMRIKAVLSNDETFDFFIYIVESNRQLILEKYSFHWQDKEGCLLIRMDNAPHFPDLPNAPHHVQKGKDVVEALLETPELLSFLGIKGTDLFIENGQAVFLADLADCRWSNYGAMFGNHNEE